MLFVAIHFNLENDFEVLIHNVTDYLGHNFKKEIIIIRTSLHFGGQFYDFFSKQHWLSRPLFQTICNFNLEKKKR
jgi:hypothetical protein